LANPEPFDGDLFTADTFVLRYKLWSLLSGRVEVEQLALAKPVLGLIMDEEGRYNYEALGGEKQATAGEEPETAPAPSTDEAAAGTPLDIVLSEVLVTDAFITMVEQDTDASMLAIEDADFTAAVQVAGGAAQGQATASIGTVSLVDMLFIRDISAPLEMSKEAVKLAPIQAKVAGGRANGAVTAHLRDGFRYEMTLDLDGVDVKTLLQEAKSAAAVAGTLKAKTSVEGTGPLPTMKAQGNAEIVDCRVEDSKMLALLSTVTKVPELASPEFEECLIEFTLARNVVTTPTVSLKGQAIQLTGQGKLNLVRSTLDYDMEMALAEELLAKIGVKELREAFVKRDDGFSVVLRHDRGAADRSSPADRQGRGDEGGQGPGEQAARGQEAVLVARHRSRVCVTDHAARGFGGRGPRRGPCMTSKLEGPQSKWRWPPKPPIGFRVVEIHTTTSVTRH
jgi:hypothetical protein